MNNFIKFAGFGIISGLVSGSLVAYNIGSNQGLGSVFTFYSPGPLFGFAVYFVLLLMNYKFPLEKVASWLTISTFAYFLAVQSIQITNTSNEHINFVIAGMVGAFIVSAGFSYSLIKLRPLGILILVILGGILTFAGTFNSDAQVQGNYTLLFVLWQAGIAGTLGIFTRLSPNNKKTNNEFAAKAS